MQYLPIKNYYCIVSCIIFYISFQLDVKEAPEPLTEHPQWDISDEEDDTKEEDKQSDISEFTTDEDVED